MVFKEVLIADAFFLSAILLILMIILFSRNGKHNQNQKKKTKVSEDIKSIKEQILA